MSCWLFIFIQDWNTNWELVNSLPADSKIQLQDHQNHYWLTSISGIFRVGEKAYKLNENLGLATKQIIVIKQNKNDIYFDTTDGLFRLSENQLEQIKVSGNADWDLPTATLFFQLGFNHSGPFAYDGQHLWSLTLPVNEHTTAFHKEYPNASFNPRGIYCIYKDPQKGYWFGTSASGMYFFDGKDMGWIYEKDQIQTPQGGDFGYRSIVVDHQNLIWINFWKYAIVWNNPKKPHTRLGEKTNTFAEQPYFLAQTID